jgi:hypothetical protein
MIDAWGIIGFTRSERMLAPRSPPLRMFEIGFFGKPHRLDSIDVPSQAELLQHLPLPRHEVQIALGDVGWNPRRQLGGRRNIEQIESNQTPIRIWILSVQIPPPWMERYGIYVHMRRPELDRFRREPTERL